METSDLVLMGSRLIIEPLQYRSTHAVNQRTTQIRLAINDVTAAIADSHRGVLLELATFQLLDRERGEAVGDSKGICGLGRKAPNRISSLHQ